MNSLNILAACFASTLAINLLGFRRTVWFVSIGYTFSIAAGAALIAILATDLRIHSILQLGILFLWAARLGWFLVQRDRNERYQKAVDDQTSRAQALPLIAKIGIWLACAVLYVCMLSPAVFSVGIAGSLGERMFAYGGVAVMIAGVAIESIADHQKSKFKREQPRQFTNIGLYRWVRCPNYFGEILVWLGSFIVGVPFYSAWWHWGLAIVGLVCIILIMMGSTKRLESKHEQRYGEDAAFREYARTVPILFPWLPIYSLKSVRVYLE